jgi:hypothetical protein
MTESEWLATTGHTCSIRRTVGRPYDQIAERTNPFVGCSR